MAKKEHSPNFGRFLKEALRAKAEGKVPKDPEEEDLAYYFVGMGGEDRVFLEQQFEKMKKERENFFKPEELNEHGLVILPFRETVEETEDVMDLVRGPASDSKIFFYPLKLNADGTMSEDKIHPSIIATCSEVRGSDFYNNLNFIYWTSKGLGVQTVRMRHDENIREAIIRQPETIVPPELRDDFKRGQAHCAEIWQDMVDHRGDKNDPMRKSDYDVYIAPEKVDPTSVKICDVCGEKTAYEIGDKKSQQKYSTHYCNRCGRYS